MKNEWPGRLYVVSAPSGAGKTSLISATVQHVPDLVVSVSHTTRQKRPGEQEGVHYNYVSDHEFEQLQQQGVFLECATVFGHAYGTSRQWVEDQLAKGVDVLLEIDWQGAAQVKRLYAANCVGLFIVPPSLVALEERLQARKQDSAAVIAERMALASEEISHLYDYDYVIINETFDQSLEQMVSIVTAERLKTRAQLARREQIFRKLLAN